MPSLRRIVVETTGQDLNRCQACMECELPAHEAMDIPLGSLVQMVLYDDEEALSSRTLWSDTVLQGSRYACLHGLDLYAVM